MTDTYTDTDPSTPDQKQPSVTDAYDKLSAEEVQDIRRFMERERTMRGVEFYPPDLPITEADKDRFADCLATGKSYSEEISRYKGKLKVTFRTRLKREDDAIMEQTFLDFEDLYTKSKGQYANRLNVYHLCFQVEALDGVPQIAPRKGANLREFAGKSIYEDMTEPKIFLLISLLSQFDAKVTTMCRDAMPDFSKPDADS